MAGVCSVLIFDYAQNESVFLWLCDMFCWEGGLVDILFDLF